MPHFMVILRTGEHVPWEHWGPEEWKTLVGKYMAWSERLLESNQLLSDKSLKLTDGDGAWIKGFGPDAVVTDGPYGETKDHIGGEYVIVARDYDEAVAIARLHPNLEYGGYVEVRQIDDMKAINAIVEG